MASLTLTKTSVVLSISNVHQSSKSNESWNLSSSFGSFLSCLYNIVDQKPSTVDLTSFEVPSKSSPSHIIENGHLVDPIVETDPQGLPQSSTTAREAVSALLSRFSIFTHSKSGYKGFLLWICSFSSLSTTATRTLRVPPPPHSRVP